MRMFARMTIAAAGLAVMAAAAPAQALELIALTVDSQLTSFTDEKPAMTVTTPVTGLSAPLIGIDFRPADKRLYGVAMNGTLYTIDPRSGAATLVSTLSEPFVSAKGAVVDFNPQADRLRLVSNDGRLNYRVNVDTGQVIKDKPLAYDAKDKAAGRTPSVMAGAYINSYAGAKATQLFHIDSARGTWIVQDPPNDGVLATIADTGLGARPIVGLDILTDAKDDYVGYALSGATLVEVSVANGKAKSRGPIGNGKAQLIDIAIVPVR